MLSTYTVNVDYDAAAPFDFNDNVVTLREAVFRANQSSDEDIIDFDPDLGGATITLGKNEQGNSISTGQLSITQSVTIDASMLTSGVTIDGGNGADSEFNTADGFTVFTIGEINPHGSDIDATLIGLTITGGDAEHDGCGNVNDSIGLAA